ncbi:MAG: type IX secretion system membrane protein PorP/SprF [Crocinitomicaceae bacterium]|nr:type IX secretion system membrane protein PorP/SprF [Crocinitomicaceae bacterium]
MKTIKVILTACVSVFVIGNANAQQEAMVSQYMFNGLFLNPAYAGSQECLTTTMLFRKQWVGFDGSPYTFIAAADMPLVENKMGVGLVLANDNIGVSNQTDIVGNYSYNIKLGEDSKLAFGLKAGMSIYSAKVSDLTTWDESDPMFESDIRNQVIPKFGFGVYYHQKEKWYAGISIPTLLAYEKGMGFSLNMNKTSFMRRHLLITGGYVFQAGESVKLKPSILMKYTAAAPFEADINFSALFKDMIWVGLSFRTGDALVTLLEYQASSSFRIGYAYDITVSKMRNFSAGSHEIMVGYDFGKADVKEKSPRYF